MFNVLDYGARRDGIVDDAPAIQAAFDQAVLWGGDVWMPPGLYLWASPVTAAFAAGNLGNSGIGRLVGYGATVLVQTAGAPFVALTVQNAGHFSVEGVRFFGTMDEANPNTPPDPLAGVIHGDTLDVQRCEFNGIMIAGQQGKGALQTGHAVVKGTRLHVERSVFAACGGSGQPLVLAENYCELAVRRCEFPDFFIRHNVTFGPAAVYGYPFSAIAACSPDPTTGASQLAAGSVVVEDVHLDEGVGGHFSICVDRTGSNRNVPAVTMRRIFQAVPPSFGSRGISVYGAGRVEIRDWFSREGNVQNGVQQSLALYTDHVDELDIAGTSTDPNTPINTCDVTAGVARARLRNCHLDRAGVNAADVLDED